MFLWMRLNPIAEEMTKSETRMTNQYRMTNDEFVMGTCISDSGFVIRISFVILV